MSEYSANLSLQRKPAAWTTPSNGKSRRPMSNARFGVIVSLCMVVAGVAILAAVVLFGA